MSRRRQVVAAIAILALGVAAGWVLRGERRGSLTVVPESDRAAILNRPDPGSPSGRTTTRLTLRRVTGGPEGTIEYDRVPTVTSPDGIKDLVLTDRDWVITIGSRAYFLSLRD